MVRRSATPRVGELLCDGATGGRVCTTYDEWGAAVAGGIRMEEGIKRLAKIETSVCEGAVWEFIKV
jgi:hypothetical protein